MKERDERKEGWGVGGERQIHLLQAIKIKEEIPGNQLGLELETF